jgi:ABC-type transport system involved in multi-copper enzyme maturation permease subunit
MLRPMTRLLGPIFAKEMVEMARRKRYYLNRVIFGLGLLCALGIAWENAGWRFGYDRVPLLQDLANLAHEMFVLVASVQYIAVFVFVPPLLCGVVASEREAHTLDLLLTTQMSDREIVMGKLASRLCVVLLLMLSGLPVMNIIMLFGGVDPASVWRVQASTLLAMVYAGAHSIYFSSATRSPLGALVRTYWWMALWLLALPLLTVLIVELFGIRPNTPKAILVYGLVLVDPLFTFMASINPRGYQEFSRHIGTWFFPVTFVVPIAWSLFLMWRAVVRLRLAPKEYAVFRDISRWFRERRSESQRRRSERVEARGAQDWTGGDNPLWHRARLSHAYDRDGHLRKIQWAGWAVAIFFLWLVAMAEPRAFRNNDAAAAFMSVTWIVIALLTAVVSAGSLVGDRRRGFFDMVLTTPLEPQEIVDGTLLAVWQHLRHGYFLAWTLTIIFCLIHPMSFWNSLLSITTAMLFGLVITMLGVLCSLTARNVTAALVPTIAFPLLVCIGPPMLLGAVHEQAVPILRVATLLALGGAFAAVRRQVNVWTVAAWFTAVHFTFAGIGQSWSDGGHQNVVPILGMNPAALTILTVADELMREIGRTVYSDINGPNSTSYYLRRLLLGEWAYAHLVLACEWIALAGTFVWARWWTIRHFDQLVGRRDTRVYEGRDKKGRGELAGVAIAGEVGAGAGCLGAGEGDYD